MTATEPPSPLLLGIDIGSSRIKVLALDGAGAEVGGAVAATPFAVGPDGVEVRVEALQAAVASALAELGPLRGRVEAVGIAGIAESGAPLDARGRPSGPVIAWHDPRGAETVAALEERFGDDLALRIGQRLRTVSSVAKLGWLAHRGVRDVRHWLGVPELCLWGLTGRRATEISLASRTGAYDVRRRRYMPEVIDALGLPPDVFAAVAPAGAVMGTVLPAGSEWSGLRPGTAVTLAGHDHLAGMAAVGADEDDLVNSVGTAETVLCRAATPPDPALALSLRVAVTVFPGGDGWGLVASGARAGRVLAAVSDRLGLSYPELDALAADGDQVDVGSLLADVERGEEVSVPASPPGRVWNGVLHALAGRTWDAVARVEELVGPAGRLIVFGGGSRSGPWLRAKAGRGWLPVWRSTAPEAVARGAGVFAGVAAGWWPYPAAAPPAGLEAVPPP